MHGLHPTPTARASLFAIEASFSDPLRHLDTWLELGGSPALVRRAVEELLPSVKPVAVAVARAALDLRHRPGIWSELAPLHDVTPSAISQRKSQFLDALDRLREDPVVADHELCDLMRARLNRVVRVEDLSQWWRLLLADAPLDAPWGCAHDVARVMHFVATGRPALVTHRDHDPAEEGPTDREWLVDRVLTNAESREPSLRSALEMFADRFGTTSVMVTADEFEERATAWGVSPASVTAFRRQLELRPVWRAVQSDDHIVVLSAADSKSAGRTVHAIKGLLELDQPAAVEVVATRQNRSERVVRQNAL